jgi:hypothetical protein
MSITWTEVQAGLSIIGGVGGTLGAVGMIVTMR